MNWWPNFKLIKYLNKSDLVNHNNDDDQLSGKKQSENERDLLNGKTSSNEMSKCPNFTTCKGVGNTNTYNKLKNHRSVKYCPYNVKNGIQNVGLSNQNKAIESNKVYSFLL